MYFSSNEINLNDLSKNQNHLTPGRGTNYNNYSPNENINVGPSYRCGYCHQLSNWKHVIEVCSFVLFYFF